MAGLERFLPQRKKHICLALDPQDDAVQLLLRSALCTPCRGEVEKRIVQGHSSDEKRRMIATGCAL